MKQQLIRLIKKNRKTFLLAEVSQALLTSLLFEVNGGKKKYPKVIQLPITFKCNSKCIMCNIWQMDSSNEATVAEFSRFMKDGIFKEVESVGINGGEPSLLPNLPEYVKEILKLPKIKSVNIISNAYNSKILLKILKEIYQLCSNDKVNFHVSISLDGVGDVHNAIRGVPNVFDKVVSAIDEIVENQHEYCDTFDVGCTVVKQNINCMMEMESFAKRKKYNVKYRLGIENKRIGSDKISDQYSVIHSPFRKTAAEFFHYQMCQDHGFMDRFKYYAIFNWLNSERPQRMLGCIWKEDGITLDARGGIYYCAVASDNIGSLREERGEKIFFDDKNIEHRKNIVEIKCDDCIHDYTGWPQLKHIWAFLKYISKDRFAMKLYKLKARFI